MKIKRFLCAFLTILLVLAIAPTAALAKGVAADVNEKAMLRLLDDAWADLEAIESGLLASRASKTETVFAMYNAAVNNPLVDKDSLTSNGFFFKVNGMCCSYDYRARNEEHESAVSAELLETISEASAKVSETRNGPTEMNILLVGPYYGIQSSFTDQYREEAASLAEYTGGEVIELAASAATGPAIAEAYPECGIVIYDSHGGAMNGTSYLCLTTNVGITPDDYTNGWAYNAGSAAYIDGRYIQNHVSSTLPNSIVWMAICEGMMSTGNGVTGTALLEAGAGCVYGYSQSVSFTGDYRMEAAFWGQMKQGATVAEAFAYMVDTICPNGYDPNGSNRAYPIVMSPDDPFPANPDSRQTVYCDWTIMGGNAEPVELENWSLSDEAVEVYRTSSVSVTFNRIPNNANNYDLVWGSENENIATVNGNKRRVTINGVGDGQTRIYCDVMVGQDAIGRAYCTVNVLHFPDLNEAANVLHGRLEFTSFTAQYPWTAAIVGDRAVAKSGGQGVANVTSTLRLVLEMQQGETLSFDWKASCEGSSSNPWDKGTFYVNNAQVGGVITGASDWATVTYTAPSNGTYTFEWRYTKDSSVNSNDDCIYVDNVTYSGMALAEPGDLDFDGEITIQDALTLLRIALQIVEPDNDQAALADVNGDGVVTIDDALYILRLALGLLA